MGREFFDALCDRENGKFYENNQLIYQAWEEERQYPKDCYLWPGAFYREVVCSGNIYRVAYKKQPDGQLDFLGHCYSRDDWDLANIVDYSGKIGLAVMQEKMPGRDELFPKFLEKLVGMWGVDEATGKRIESDIFAEAKKRRVEAKEYAIREWKHNPDEIIEEVIWTIKNDLPEGGFEMEADLRDAIRRGFGGSLAATTDLEMTAELSHIVDAGEFKLTCYKMRVVAEIPGVDPYPELLVEYHYDLDGTITLDEIYG